MKIKKLLISRLRFWITRWQKEKKYFKRMIIELIVDENFEFARTLYENNFISIPTYKEILELSDYKERKN